jgi:hypothetical protein
MRVFHNQIGSAQAKRLMIWWAVVFGCWIGYHEAKAFSGPGHMTIAAGAYRELPCKIRDQVDALFKSHPEYGIWKDSFGKQAKGSGLGLFVFMEASKWADEIRRKNSEYNHPNWHFIDYPLKPPDFLMEPGPSPGDDVLFGIAQSEKILSDKAMESQQRAVYLAWLIHLIGDLHQPLHCGELVNDVYPKGDKGGNEFYVMPANKGIKLHAFWDELLGTGNQAKSRVNYAVELAHRYPRKKLQELKGAAAQEWSLESRMLAMKQAYLNGELKGSTTPDSAPHLPSGYAKAAKTVAERRAALAAYRLADEIARCLK